MLIILLSNSFSDLPVALVGNFVFQQKRTFGERKHILRPPRTIPVAILLVKKIFMKLNLRIFGEQNWSQRCALDVHVYVWP
jgi:hypothetical protein